MHTTFVVICIISFGLMIQKEYMHQEMKTDPLELTTHTASKHNNYSKSGGFSCQNAFSLMRELLRYEDIDLKPDEEFTRIKEYICREYGIIPNSFLKMYSDFRKMLQI